jgi:hypothetical protein
VWESVREKAGRHGVSSPTHAQADVYRSRTGALGAIRAAFPLVPGQCGALFALGDTVTLDWVSRPDAWTRLYPRLLQGYALDALEQLDGNAAQRDTLDAFVGSLDLAPRTHRPSPALGDDVRLRADGVVGSALELDGELVQLSAYSTQGGAAPTRIARPSRRR